jgi:hypothetical protein
MSLREKNLELFNGKNGVVDPDPNVFGHPGSRIRHYLYGSGSESFHQQAKKVRKTFISTIFYFYLTFYL